MSDDTVMQLSGPLVLQFTTTSKWVSHTLKTLMKTSIYNRVADNTVLIPETLLKSLLRLYPGPEYRSLLRVRRGYDPVSVYESS